MNWTVYKHNGRKKDNRQMENRDNTSDKAMEQNQKFKISVIGREITNTIECNGSESLLEAMVRQGIYISAACGGRGTCGKCKILLISGSLPVTVSDKHIFSDEELREGYRLSCKAYPKSDCSIKLAVGDETDFEVVTEHQNFSTFQKIGEGSYAIAIDIGTTTIAVSLVERAGSSTLWTYSSVNRQRAYGADVIARMQASNAGKKEELKKCIQQDLLQGMAAVVEKTGINKENITKVSIAGNTTMGHLLLGFSCETLGIFPFTPVNIKEMVLPFKEVFASDYLEAEVVLLPGISTYVGGDISAGLLSCGFDRTEAVCLLIDLGTNGEMAIGNKKRIIVTSTAAGPAFEGGNISCGVGSITGAICNVDIKDGRAEYRTIADGAAVGICGTGVVEIVAELIRAGIADETGLLSEDYFDDGYVIATDKAGKAISFTQKDIREIQLAKAAVHAGIEILIRRFDINYEELDTVYLAGGFGYKINIQKAIDIGLLPKKLQGKIKAIGNSSLSGAIEYLKEEAAHDRMQHIIEISTEINLSNDKDFNELYVDSMYFEE
jgi:Uncharacterized metal-binding protein